MRWVVVSAILTGTASLPLRGERNATSVQHSKASELRDHRHKMHSAISLRADPNTTIQDVKLVSTEVTNSARVSTTTPTVTDEAQLQASPDPIEMEVQQDLAQMNAERDNINQLKQALGADVALLRESSQLAKVAMSAASKTAAIQQVKKTDQVVRDLSGILRNSRASALQTARSMLRRADNLGLAAKTLHAEAKKQLALAEVHPHSHSAP